MFTKLFRQNPPAEIETLRAAVTQGTADASWRQSFHEKAESLAAEVLAARQRLQQKPSEAAANALVAAVAAQVTQTPGLREVHASLVSWNEGGGRERLMKTLPPALEAAIKFWSREKAALAAEDEARAVKLGVPASELEGGLSKKIEARIEAAKDALDEMENAGSPRLAHHATWLLQCFA